MTERVDNPYAPDCAVCGHAATNHGVSRWDANDQPLETICWISGCECLTYKQAERGPLFTSYVAGYDAGLRDASEDHPRKQERTRTRNAPPYALGYDDGYYEGALRKQRLSVAVDSQ